MSRGLLSPQRAPKRAGVWNLTLVLAATLLLAHPAAAEKPGNGSARARAYTLDFIATPNLAEQGDAVNGASASVNGIAARGRMTIRVRHGQTDVEFSLSGARPNTIYTIWTVFKRLTPGWNSPAACASSVPFFPCATSDLPNWYREANAVAPLARLDAAFTDGMGLDPGATFVTNARGSGEVHVTLDYALLGGTQNRSPQDKVLSEDGPPLANKAVITQCVPIAPGSTVASTCTTSDGAPGVSQRVTSTWLRKYVSQVISAGGDPAAMCAQYGVDPTASVYWQCIDPATVDPRTGNGLPRVFRYPFDHFRLAAHPDGLTHGFIGGTEDEHVIDMVGRRCDIQPAVPLPDGLDCAVQGTGK